MCIIAPKFRIKTILNSPKLSNIQTGHNSNTCIKHSTMLARTSRAPAGNTCKVTQELLPNNQVAIMVRTHMNNKTTRKYMTIKKLNNITNKHFQWEIPTGTFSKLARTTMPYRNQEELEPKEVNSHTTMPTPSISNKPIITIRQITKLCKTAPRISLATI